VPDQRILFFGDSLVAGVGDPSGQGWVGRVVAEAFAAGLPLTAYNLGVRGETSVAVAARWQRESVPRLLPGADCRLVLSFGANDASAQAPVEPDASVRALTRVVRAARHQGLPVLVVGPAPVNDGVQKDRITALSVAFAIACRGLEVPFVEVSGALRASQTWNQEIRAGDGAHPGADGYAELAGLVREHWLRWLGAPGEL
jgi:acyl-CoA thioesterase-1